jgi:RNA polymerase sigma-70 factor (ECF subfamily)
MTIPANIDPSPLSETSVPIPQERSSLSDEEFAQELERHLPHLRAFARVLCRSRDLADDMVQEALMKGWAARRRFHRGTRFKAWIFTILRNSYLTFVRRGKFEGTYVEGAELTMKEPANQVPHVELLEVQHALTKLPKQQQETLMLVVGEGMSYAEAAEVCGCMIGTIKSRVARARSGLQAILDGEHLPDAAD